jgi:glutamyl-tRNA synthetase
MAVITRIPPSPTGNLHVGTARTALFNYLYAKKMGGKVLLRMEDTDRERSKKEFEENIVDGLKWLGIECDGEMVRQSERVASHTAALEKLIAAGKAYVSKEPAKDDPTITRELVRFRNPGGRLAFHDEIRGEVDSELDSLGDFVLAKSMTEPLYHLAVVVDDLDAGVTHVIRGEDHISNTARQILLIEALGASRPKYAHLPLLLGLDRSKLSKRHGATALSSFRDQGYLPEAMVNFLALLGWNPGQSNDGEFAEIFSMDELVKSFSLEHCSKSGAIFNIEKLKWFNKTWMLTQHDDLEANDAIAFYLAAAAPDAPTERLRRCAETLRHRISVYGEVGEMAKAGDLAYLQSAAPNSDLILKGKGVGTAPEAAARLQKAAELLSGAPDASWGDKEAIKAVLWPYAEAEGKGAVLWPVRVALSGLERSPDPFELAWVLGKDETLARLSAAAAALA